MKTHYIKSGEFYSVCGKYHPYPSTFELSKVTCNRCLEKSGMMRQPSMEERLKIAEGTIENQGREIANLKKAMRKIMEDCLEHLHPKQQDT